MRLDYALYVIAVILFVITISVAAISVQQNLWVLSTAIIGIAAVGTGYLSRPQATKTSSNSSPVNVTEPIVAQPAQPIVVSQPAPIVSVAEQKTAITTPTVSPPLAVATPAATIEPKHEHPLTTVKGIGEKRATQLKSIGINNVHELATASSARIAKELKLSKKIVDKWVAGAKKQIKK
jgi:predicted flap endonuclease-1-like 5' DNA nuclease